MLFIPRTTAGPRPGPTAPGLPQRLAALLPGRSPKLGFMGIAGGHAHVPPKAWLGSDLVDVDFFRLELEDFFSGIFSDQVFYVFFHVFLSIGLIHTSDFGVDIC